MGDEAGGWEAVFGAAAPPVRAAAEAMRDAIRARHPGAVEIPRPGERSYSFGHGAAKMSEAYAYLMPHARHANLGFLHGADLPDPEGRLEGTGKRLRHVKLRGPEAARDPAVLALLEAAVEERARARRGGGGVMGRGSGVRAAGGRRCPARPRRRVEEG